MCQEYQYPEKETGLLAWIANAVIIIIFGLGIVLFGYIAMYHDDLFRPFHEYRHQVRIEEMKKAGVWRSEEDVGGYRSQDSAHLIGVEFTWDTKKEIGRDTPLNPKDIPPPPPEAPDLPLPPAK